MSEINEEDMEYILNGIKEYRNKPKLSAGTNNLRIAESCINCGNLIEDIELEGSMSFYKCPFQGEEDITREYLVCDKYIKAVKEPKKTERRKNTMDFVELMDYNSKHPGQCKNNILHDDEIETLTNAMYNADRLAVDINKPMAELLDEVFEEEDKKPLEEDFEYGIFGKMKKHLSGE